jgi:ribose transport system ATP-binding protein
MAPLLRLENISRSFSGVPVLRPVTLELGRGEVLGIVGENGAGKSTLMNVLGGVLPADSGAMTLEGLAYAPRDAADASARGIAFVHQELNLFPNLNIAENLFLANFPRWRFAGLQLLDYRAARDRSRQLLQTVKLPLDPDTPVERLSQGERQLVEIAKALDRKARIVIFDEPTTSLTPRESARLFEIVHDLKERGAGVIYISHALPEVLRICDRIVVLRDGAVAGVGPAAEFDEARMISLMVGRAVDQLYPERPAQASSLPVLEARHLSHPSILEDVSFTLHGGEVLGVAGLMGSGRSELARILFGLDRCERGDVLLAGEALGRMPPRERIRRGMALLTENRREDGLLMEAPVLANLALVWPKTDRLRSVAQSVRLHCANLDRQPVRQLSGGNQQKVALGKWLVEMPRVLILDEPTRGIDVGAKPEIYRIVAEVASKGAGVLLISSEVEELIGLSDRIVVMRRGELRGSLTRAEFDRERILQIAV